MNIPKFAQEGIMVYIHIPKNAGTTFKEILARNYGAGYHQFYTDRRGKLLKEDELRELISSLPTGARALSGHNLLPYPDLIEQLSLNYVTLIRDPVSRAISLYHYERKTTHGTDHISQRSFDDYLDVRPTIGGAITDFQTYNLTGGRDVAEAKRILDRFFVVGLVERFDEFLCLLSHSLNGAFDAAYIPLNVSGDRVVSAETLTISQQKRILEMNRADSELFAYAGERLERDLSVLTDLPGMLSELNKSSESRTSPSGVGCPR